MSTITSEQETTITYNVADDRATVWSASPLFHRQMARLSIDPVTIEKDSDGKIRSAQYIVSKKWVKIRKPKAISESRRQAMRDNARSRFKRVVEN